MLLTVLTVSVFISGCANNSVNTYENADKKAKVDVVMDKRIITDSHLKARLAYREIRQSKTNDGIKRVQVFMKARRGGLLDPNSPRKILYRFNWFDEQGVLVKEEDGVGWQKKLVLPGDDAVFTSVAPSKDCYDFKIRLKEIE